MASRVANRYAKAFLESLTKVEQAPEILAAFNQFQGLLEENKDLKLALHSQFFLIEKQKKVLKDVLALMKVPEKGGRFLTVLLEKHRLKELPEIIKRFEILYLNKSGVVPLEVWTRKAIKAPEKEELEKKFSKHFGKQVKAYYQVNPELIGGLKVEAFGKTYDGSVLSTLKNFEEKRIAGV